jgi:hypothetical protein
MHSFCIPVDRIMKLSQKNLFLLVFLLMFVAACSSSKEKVPLATMPKPLPEPSVTQTDTPKPQKTPTEIAPIPELDKIIAVVLQDEAQELVQLLEFTPLQCTKADGLGGPPKCTPDENEGDIVEVLPMMGPEGHFLRKEEMHEWGGLEITELYAVYKNAEDVFVDENYPAGEYAIAFMGKGKPEITHVTLQVSNGKIVRIDFGIGNPPDINENDGRIYLVSPPDTIE